MKQVIGLISANFDTPEMKTLTEERTIASMPFACRYRLIDFAISNLVHAGIKSVGLVTPYKYRSIIDHVASGRSFGLDRKTKGLFILPGSVFGISSLENRFLLRDIRRNRIYLTRADAEYVFVTAANLVSNSDYRAMLEEHIRSGADVTIAVKNMEYDSNYLYQVKEEDGRVTSLTKGVRTGETGFLDSFIISTKLLEDICQWYESKDFMDLTELLNDDLKQIRVKTYALGGYTRNIFTIQDYYDASMDVLQHDVSKDLFARSHTILTKTRSLPPTKYLTGATVHYSLVPNGCEIAGTVENSLLFRNAVVEKGAVVRDSILAQSCVVEEGAIVENAIIDRGNVVRKGTILKGTKDNLLVIGKNELAE